MLKIKRVFQYIFDSDYRFTKDSRSGKYNHLTDEEYLRRMYSARMKRELNLENPQTFTEKLQWLKLYDRQPKYTMMVDKYAVKNYVSETIGTQYVIPTLGVWDCFEEIDFDSLPEQFVLKCTHDSGGLVICKCKTTLDRQKANKKISESLKRDFYMTFREWPYKDVQRRIIAEKYMEDNATNELRDYKFFCFDGEPKLLFVASDRLKTGEEVKFDFFDMDFNHLDIRNEHPNASVRIQKPCEFELMKELARKLSKGIPHVRVDLYEVDGRVYFGEMTFFHFSGMKPFEPEKWDFTMGEWLQLPMKMQT